jgi:hypothetical protein
MLDFDRGKHEAAVPALVACVDEDTNVADVANVGKGI